MHSPRDSICLRTERSELAEQIAQARTADLNGVLGQSPKRVGVQGGRARAPPALAERMNVEKRGMLWRLRRKKHRVSSQHFQLLNKKPQAVVALAPHSLWLSYFIS